MSLKLKLLLSFIVMLVLILAVTLTGWQTTRTMGNQAIVLAEVDNAVSFMLRSQSRQLLYIMTKDQSLTANVLKYMDDAEKAIKIAQEIMSTQEGRNKASNALEFLNWYRANFSKLINDTQRYQKIEQDMVALTGGINSGFEKTTQNAKELVKENYTERLFASLTTTEETHMAFINARLYVRAFTTEPTQENAKKATEQITETFKSLQRVATLLSNPENQVIAKKMLENLDQYIKMFGDLKNISLNNSALTLEIRSKMIESLEDMEALSKLAGITLISAKENGNNMSMIVTVIALICGIGIAFGLSNNVQKQLGKDPSQLAEIATRVSNGDYEINDGSPTIGVYGNIINMVTALKKNIENANQESTRAHDETQKAQLATQQAEQSSNLAQEKTNAMLQAADKLEEIGSILSSALSQLSAQIEQSERGSSDQAARVTETATAMEEMNSTVLEVAKNATTASNVSNATRQKAESGAMIVQQAVTSIQQVQTQAMQLKDDMNKLDENAQSITKIMSVISDIADQTNLLALNAAIEAARAGDAGRGFAVVADEVRKLAEKTMASTTDVGNAIRAIQQSVAQSMGQMDSAVKTIEEATGFSNQSGLALQEIVGMIDNTADQVRAIATASEQQSASSEEINRSISHINGIATETARAMQEASHAVSDLTNQAHVLARLIGDLKRS